MGEREILKPDGSAVTPAELFASLTDDQLEQEIARIFDRGVVSSRLVVDLPPGVHGEWVPTDPLEISRKQALGFTIDDVYAPKTALHSDGTKKGIVGDVIFMTCPQRMKDAFDSLALKRYHETHGKRTHEPKLKEEKEYHNQAEIPGYISTDPKATGIHSSTEVVDSSVIAAAKAASMNVDNSGGNS